VGCGPCKGTTQAYRDIPHIVALVPCYLRFHQQEAFFPTQKYRLHDSTRVNQVAHDSFSQFLSQGGIIQHQLMSPENFNQSGIDFLFRPV